MPDEEKPSDQPGQVEALPPDPIPDAEVVDSVPEPEPKMPESPVVPPQTRRSGSFPGFVLGGLIAAGAGFGLAQVVPGGWPLRPDSSLANEIAAQTTELAALKATVAKLSERPVPDFAPQIAALRDDLEARLAALPATVDPAPSIADLRATVDTALASFDTRLTEVEKAPTGSGGGVSATALAAYERELQALAGQVTALQGAGGQSAKDIEALVASAKAELAAATEQAGVLKSQSEAEARNAKLSAALGRIAAALEAGGPFASAVTDLTEAGIEVPAPLPDLSQTGLPTLTDLQRSFPAAARAALDAALHANVGEGWQDRLGNFIKIQTGARSVEPQEGSDPDAILSRADAAVGAGDIATALTELAALPEAAKPALSDWIAKAQSRQDAAAALAALVAAANAN